MLKNSSSSSKNPNPTIPTPTLSNKFKRRIKPIIQKALLKLKPSSQITLTFWAKCNFLFYSVSNTRLTKARLTFGMLWLITSKTALIHMRKEALPERVPLKIAKNQNKKFKSCLLRPKGLSSDFNFPNFWFFHQFFISNLFKSFQNKIENLG
jgi:hypothetical protein